MESDIAEITQLLKVLADSNRLKIIEMLVEGEKCGCHLLERIQITQPTLSHHMKLLCECGLVSVRREGKWMHYALNQSSLKTLSLYFDELYKKTVI